jgi:protein-tyrosine phosphatase
MVDIHSHILPGLDDGAKTLEESVAMLRMAAQDGTTDIVATPHSDLQYSFDPDLVTQKIAELEEAAGGVIAIHRGCDFHLHYDNIQDALANPAKYAINHRRYILVEFSDLLIARTTDEVFFRMLAAGMTPIITHPERNPLLQRRLEQLEAWVAQGILLQVTAQSFLGQWGREAKAFADVLMKRNLVHFVASDAHDAARRPPLLGEACRYVAGRWGERTAQALFVTNPKAALSGDPVDLDLPAPEPEAPPKRWYEFWR